jgi:hypothetical protein
MSLQWQNTQPVDSLRRDPVFSRLSSHYALFTSNLYLLRQVLLKRQLLSKVLADLAGFIPQGANAQLPW